MGEQSQCSEACSIADCTKAMAPKICPDQCPEQGKTDSNEMDLDDEANSINSSIDDENTVEKEMEENAENEAEDKDEGEEDNDDASMKKATHKDSQMNNTMQEETEENGNLVTEPEETNNEVQEELEEAESYDKDNIESNENTGVVECYVIHTKCTFRKCTQHLECKPKDIEK